MNKHINNINKHWKELIFEAYLNRIDFAKHQHCVDKHHEVA